MIITIILIAKNAAIIIWYIPNDYQNFLIQDFFLAYNEFLMHISLAWRLFIVHYA